MNLGPTSSASHRRRRLGFGHPPVYSAALPALFNSTFFYTLPPCFGAVRPVSPMRVVGSLPNFPYLASSSCLAVLAGLAPSGSAAVAGSACTRYLVSGNLCVAPGSFPPGRKAGASDHRLGLGCRNHGGVRRGRTPLGLSGRGRGGLAPFLFFSSPKFFGWAGSAGACRLRSWFAHLPASSKLDRTPRRSRAGSGRLGPTLASSSVARLGRSRRGRADLKSPLITGHHGIGVLGCSPAPRGRWGPGRGAGIPSSGVNRSCRTAPGRRLGAPWVGSSFITSLLPCTWFPIYFLRPGQGRADARNVFDHIGSVALATPYSFTQVESGPPGGGQFQSPFRRCRNLPARCLGVARSFSTPVLAGCP